MDYSKTFAVVPETPEGQKIRRRSTRRSTMSSSVATASILRQIAGTPESQEMDVSMKRTIIGESPFSTPGQSLSKRASELEIAGSPAKKNFHPVFTKQTKPKISESKFEEYVPATQDPGAGDRGSMTPKSKVQAWLIYEQLSESPLRKKRRQSNVKSVSKFLLDRSNASTNADNNSSTDDFEAELAKITKGKQKVKDTSMFSTQSSTETNKLIKETVDDIVADLDANEDEHIPYRPPSFQDYSSDSAKALMTKYENKGSLTPQAESSRRLPCQVTVRRTRSLEEPKNSTENEEVPMEKVLENVCAYVEVRSKNENRSDVVIDQLVALGASVVPRIGTKCTHVLFKEGSLATYNKAKKLGLFIVSVNWLEACKISKIMVSESLYPTMNQDKYDSPGLFPKLRKTKSLQPKSDEEFSKMIEAKAMRVMKKKLADSPVIQESPKSNTKIPRRRRSRILETLREYEEEAEKASPEMPGSPCSSEELNTPLLKRIAKKLFKAQQASPSTESPISKAIELEISNDGFSDMDMTCENKRPKETPKNGHAPKKSPIINSSPKNTTSQRKKRTLVDTTKKANEVNLATKRPDSAAKRPDFKPPTKKTDDIASLPFNKRPEPDTTKKANEVNLATKRPDSVTKRPVFRPPTKKTDDIASLPVNKRPESVQKDLSLITKKTSPTSKRPNMIEEQINKTMELQQPSPKQRPTKSKVKRRTLDFSAANNRKITDFFGLCSTPPTC